MASMIDWYAVELKLLLQGKLPENRVEEIVKEAEGHLRESAHRRQSALLAEEMAVSAAIAAYGKPDRVAMGFLKGSRQTLWGLNPGVWACLGAFITIFCWNFHWLTLAGHFDNFGETWQNGLAGVIGIFGLAFMVAAIRAGLRSYRFWIMGLTCAAAALSVPLLSYWMIPAPGAFQGISRLHLDRDLPSVKKNLIAIRAYDSYVERGMREYSAARSSIEISSDLKEPAIAARELAIDPLQPAVLGVALDRGGPYVVPRRFGAFFEIDGRSVVLETMNQFSDAKKAWAEYGPSILKDLRTSRTTYSNLVTNAAQTKCGKLFFPDPDLYIQTVIGTLVLLPLFLLLDWAAAATARPRRKWPRVATA